MKLYVTVPEPYEEYTIDEDVLRIIADDEAGKIISQLFGKPAEYKLIAASHFVVPIMSMKPYFTHKYFIKSSGMNSTNYNLYVVYDIVENKRAKFLGQDGKLGALEIRDSKLDSNKFLNELEYALKNNDYKIKFVYTTPFIDIMSKMQFKPAQ